ncbi:hypothetical protein FGO68_gene9952 [Halteria grandinella]|uniref:Uncharacterized protein n=1 Tax=Halteria grandinella TaxID=5974 RepID=A0A8J8NVW0_HALGN|nr:hypothetical protein FGO68_gene9952 [Halteria grandinella]
MLQMITLQKESPVSLSKNLRLRFLIRLGSIKLSSIRVASSICLLQDKSNFCKLTSCERPSIIAFVLNAYPFLRHTSNSDQLELSHSLSSDLSENRLFLEFKACVLILKAQNSLPLFTKIALQEHDSSS